MEDQHQQCCRQKQQGVNEEGGSKNGASNYLCRQSCTRWTPITEQILILKDLYYNKGVRSPSAEQIQRISGKLRQFGKIEEKNVFYWFQNHKARERQKKRLTTAATVTPHGALHYKCPFIDHKMKSFDETQEEDLQQQQQEAEGGDDDDEKPSRLETLPLFPVHGDSVSTNFCSIKHDYSISYDYTTTTLAWYHPGDNVMAGSRASLELSLNPYSTSAARRSP